MATYSGTDTSSDYVGAAISSTTILSSLFGPLRIEFIDEQAQPDGLPVHLDDPQDAIEFANLTTGDLLASAQLCGGGTPKLLVHTGGRSLAFPLAFATDGGGQTYLKVPIPVLSWELAAMLGTTTALNVFVPVSAAHELTVALDSAPAELLVDVDLDALPGCRADRAVPAAGPLALGALLLSLLAGGTWLAMRRRTVRA